MSKHSQYIRAGWRCYVQNPLIRVPGAQYGKIDHFP